MGGYRAPAHSSIRTFPHAPEHWVRGCCAHAPRPPLSAVRRCARGDVRRRAMCRAAMARRGARGSTAPSRCSRCIALHCSALRVASNRFVVAPRLVVLHRSESRRFATGRVTPRFGLLHHAECVTSRRCFAAHHHQASHRRPGVCSRVTIHQVASRRVASAYCVLDIRLAVLAEIVVNTRTRDQVGVRPAPSNCSNGRIVITH